MIRRVFFLIVLLGIAFFVYRYVNPSGANDLVLKIKSIPSKIFNKKASTGSIIETGQIVLINTGNKSNLTGSSDNQISTGSKQLSDDELVGNSSTATGTRIIISPKTGTVSTTAVTTSATPKTTTTSATPKTTTAKTATSKTTTTKAATPTNGLSSKDIQDAQDLINSLSQ